MVGAGLVDRLGLGALGEGGVSEARGKGVAVFLGGGDGLGEAGFFGVQVDNPFEREDDGVACND